MEKLKEYVEDINEGLEKLDTRGPVSKYILPDENLKGRWMIYFLLYYPWVVTIMVEGAIYASSDLFL